MHRKHTVDINHSGFTLVELLVSIAVVGLAGLGIATLFYTIQYTQQQSMYYDAATRAAQRQIEVLRNSSYNSLPNDQDIIFTDDLPGILPSDKQGIVHVSEPTSGVKKVDVTVSYSSHGRNKQVSMSSLIGVIGLGQ